MVAGGNPRLPLGSPDAMPAIGAGHRPPDEFEIFGDESLKLGQRRWDVHVKANPTARMSVTVSPAAARGKPSRQFAGQGARRKPTLGGGGLFGTPRAPCLLHNLPRPALRCHSECRPPLLDTRLTAG